MSAVSRSTHSRHVCCVKKQTCLLCETMDMSAVCHSRHVCYVTQQTCLLCNTADMSAVRHSRHICCVTQQTCPSCLRHKPWFCVAQGEGQAPPCPRRNCPLRHIQNLHYAKPWFFVAGGERLAPPLLRHKTKAVCRKQSSGARAKIYTGINHLSWVSTHALRQKLRIGQT